MDFELNITMKQTLLLLLAALILATTPPARAVSGSAMIFNVTVNTRSAVSTLAGLTLSSGALSPAFVAATMSYTASVPNATTSMTVTPTVTDATATVKVNGTTVTSGVASGAISLVVGSNPITVLVTAQDGTTQSTYTVDVTRTLILMIGLLSNGSITGASTGGDYLTGTYATLTAVPAAGYRFTGWTEDASGTANPLSLLMNANKILGATFLPDTNDDDDDDLSNYDEIFTSGTDPKLKDTDGDGLEDGWEAGLGRFSIIAGAFTWAQARADAHARGGELACFPTANRWNRAMGSFGVGATDNYTGLWIGASDASTEGAWSWVNGEAFAFGNWATSRPSAAAGNILDYAEVSGGGGAELDKWYDRTATFIRDGYILEMGYATDPTKDDTDGDGSKDGAEITAGTNPIMADTDGDGYLDGAEAACGSNPLATFSVPEFKTYNVLALDVGTIQFSFPAQQGRTYSVLDSIDLVHWNGIETNIIGQGAVITRTYSTVDQTKRFFRVEKIE